MEEWVCVDGCPVRELGLQSGTTKSTDRPRKNTAEAHNRTNSMGKSSADWTTNGHADSGTAARFFMQFAGEDDLLREPVETGVDARVEVLVEPTEEQIAAALVRFR